MHAEHPSPSCQLTNTFLSICGFGRGTHLQPGCLLVGGFPNPTPTPPTIIFSSLRIGPLQTIKSCCRPGTFLRHHPRCIVPPRLTITQCLLPSFLLVVSFCHPILFAYNTTSHRDNAGLRQHAQCSTSSSHAVISTGPVELLSIRSVHDTNIGVLSSIALHGKM
jgi:hypothetical protein